MLSLLLSTLRPYLFTFYSLVSILELFVNLIYTTLLTKGKHDKMESSLFSFSMKTFILIRVKGAFMNYNLPYVQHVMPFRETMK